MILKTFTLLALILILSSCMSYRYMGSTDAEYGDNTKTERNVALQINFFSGFYLKRELKAALVKKGFDGLHFGKGYKGYSIEVGVESKMKETLGFFASTTKVLVAANELPPPGVGNVKSASNPLAPAIEPPFGLREFMAL